MSAGSKTKNRVLALCLVSLTTIFTFHSVGEEETAPIRPLRLVPTPPESLNRFGLGYRMGFNVTARFKNFGNFSSLFPKPAALTTPDGDVYNYDNGYVYPDAGTANSGLTHYWGYQGFTYTGGSQLPGDGTILMQRAASRGTSPGLSTGARDDDPLPGVELTYNRQLGSSRHFRWGLESAFNYANVSIHDDSPLRGSASLRTDVVSDAYPLLVPEGLLPPAGYQGRKNIPAVVIGATPQSSQQFTLPGVTMPEVVTGSREFDADLFGFRLGPYLEIPINHTFSVEFSGGLALAEVSSDFAFTETIQAGSVRLPTRRGSGSHSDLLTGGYASGTVTCALTRGTGLFASVQFQDLGQYTQTLNRRDAVLDLGDSLFVTFGLSYSF